MAGPRWTPLLAALRGYVPLPPPAPPPPRHCLAWPDRAGPHCWQHCGDTSRYHHQPRRPRDTASHGRTALDPTAGSTAGIRPATTTSPAAPATLPRMAGPRWTPLLAALRGYVPLPPPAPP